MRVSSRQLFTIVSILAIFFLPACGGDTREKRVSVSSSKSLPSEILQRIEVPTSAAPTSTTTTTVDPKVLVFYLKQAQKFLIWKKGHETKDVAHSTSSHGPHSNAWWRGVSVCEQGGRNDSYFGYFSYMDGSAGGKSWPEQVAMGNRTISQYGEDMNYGGAWAHKCVLAGYSASPSG